MNKERLVVGLSGASGVIYGIRLLEMLKDIEPVETHLVISSWAERIIPQETDYKVSDIKAMADRVYENDNMGAAISSGSFKTMGMVVVPCSMKTLSAISHGYTENLLHRAADVIIKERRKLVIVPRETPLSSIHLQNLLRLSELGAVIMPPVPAMYHNPKDLMEVINHTVVRIIDQLGYGHLLTNAKRWSGTV